MNKFNSAENYKPAEIKEDINPIISEKIDKQLVLQCIEEFLLHHQKVNEGNNGIIALPNNETFDKKVLANLFIDTEDKSKIDLAIKMMKVYSSLTQTKQEAEIHEKSYQLNQEWLEKKPQDLYPVLIPELFFGGKIKITQDEVVNQLEEEGVAVVDKTVGVLLMDRIKGEDLATYLYSEIVKHHTPEDDDEELQTLKNHLENYFQNPDPIEDPNYFPLLQQYVQKALDFEVAGGKGRDEGEKEFELRKIESENAKKIRHFLGKKGVVLDKKILDSLSSFIAFLHQAGVYHRDIHEKNIMLVKEKDEVKSIYLIDFGSAISTEGLTKSEIYEEDGKGYKDDEYIIRNYLKLTTPLEDQEKKDFFSKLNRDLEIIKTRRVAEYEKFSKLIKSSIDKLSIKGKAELNNLNKKITKFANEQLKDTYSEDNFLLQLALWNEIAEQNYDIGMEIKEYLSTKILEAQKNKIPFFENTVRSLAQYINDKKN